MDTLVELDRINKRFGSTVTAQDFSLNIGRGEFFTMLGPSGSGKSTILRIIAGLEQPDSGTIRINGKDVSAIPPWHRKLGMVFQQYANFPHMNVAANIAYGLKNQGWPKADIGRRVDELLRLVGLTGYGSRPVTQLSGGEQQRVAIARALAPQPALLLLDEPLAALDEKIRREMQEELRRIQRTTGTTFIYVTHDQEEALTMSDRIAVLNLGRAVQCDSPQAIFQAPRTPFVAHFFRGCNVLDAVLADGSAGSRVSLASAWVSLPEPVDKPAGPVKLAIRGEKIRFAPSPSPDALALSAQLDAIVYRGLYSDYKLRLPDGQPMVATLTHVEGLAPGTTVPIAVAASDIIVLDET